MADIYVRSGATGAADGTSWADAYVTLTAALSGRAATDVVWLADDHAESTAGAVALVCPTTPGLRILCAANHTTEPPTTLGATASVAVGASSNALSVRGNAYIYGVTFLGGTNASAACLLDIGNSTIASGLIFDNCTFQLRSSTTGTSIVFGPTASGSLRGVGIELLNCTLRFNNTGQYVQARSARIRAANLSISSAGSTPTTLLNGENASAAQVLIESSDLTGRSFTNLAGLTAGSVANFVFRNCKLPSGVVFGTGSYNSPKSLQLKVHNCDSGDTNYALWEGNYSGSVAHETVVVRSGGASDGTTPLSWKLISSANATYPLTPLVSPEIVQWNDATGSALTATVEVVTDGVTLDNDECWLELQYLGTSGVPLGAIASDAPSDVLATPAAQTSSSETWTTTGLSSPVKQSLSVTFTPQEKGFVHAVVKLAKASTTVYVCPKLTVS